MNCSLLDDENYRKEPRLRLKCLSGRPSADVTCRITAAFGIGLSQYKLRAHAVQFSKSKAKRKAKEKKKDKENILKDEFNNAEKTFECDPTNNCKHLRRKKNWNIFVKKNFKVSSFAHGHDGVNTAKRERNIFSIWRKGTTSKNMCEN